MLTIKDRLFSDLLNVFENKQGADLDRNPRFAHLFLSLFAERIAYFREHREMSPVIEKAIVLLPPSLIETKEGQLFMEYLKGLPPTTVERSFRKLLYDASKIGNLALVKKLIQERVNVKSKFDTDLAPLHIACIQGNESVAMELLQAGADLHQIGQGKTPLEWAVEYGRYALAGKLIGAGALSQKSKQEVHQLLCDYISIGALPPVKNMLGLNDINVPFDNEMTPLTWACHEGQSAIVAELLHQGADITVRGQGLTPVAWAVECGHPALLLQLLDQMELDEELRVELSYEVYTAAQMLHDTKNQNYELILLELVKRGISPLDVSGINDTALNLCSKSTFNKILPLLPAKEQQIAQLLYHIKFGRPAAIKIFIEEWFSDPEKREFIIRAMEIPSIRAALIAYGSEGLHSMMTPELLDSFSPTAQADLFFLSPPEQQHTRFEEISVYYLSDVLKRPIEFYQERFTPNELLSRIAPLIHRDLDEEGKFYFYEAFNAMSPLALCILMPQYPNVIINSLEFMPLKHLRMMTAFLSVDDWKASFRLLPEGTRKECLILASLPKQLLALTTRDFIMPQFLDAERRLEEIIRMFNGNLNEESYRACCESLDRYNLIQLEQQQRKRLAILEKRVNQIGDPLLDRVFIEIKTGIEGWVKSIRSTYDAVKKEAAIREVDFVVNIPSQFICPITQEFPEDPLFVQFEDRLFSKNAYERDAITQMREDPVTKKKIVRFVEMQEMLSNEALSKESKEFVSDLNALVNAKKSGKSAFCKAIAQIFPK